MQRVDRHAVRARHAHHTTEEAALHVGLRLRVAVVQERVPVDGRRAVAHVVEIEERAPGRLGPVDEGVARAR